MEPMAERGFLVLADISGFTQFVAGTELEHGPPIIADLLEVVIARLAPPLAVQEVEGDAVFAFGLDGAIVPATTLLDVVDDAFVAFKARRRVLAADESCSCRACRSVGSLDLKIIAHHGAFLRQTVAGWMEIDPRAAGLVAQSQRYEHLGEVRCFVAEPGSIARLSPAAV